VPTLALILVPAAAIFLVTWLVLAYREGELERVGRAVPALPWLVAGVVITVVGILLVPRLFGFAALFLPLVWTRRGRGRRAG
jgi:hypothetical protein